MSMRAPLFSLLWLAACADSHTDTPDKDTLDPDLPADTPDTDVPIDTEVPDPTPTSGNFIEWKAGVVLPEELAEFRWADVEPDHLALGLSTASGIPILPGTVLVGAPLGDEDPYIRRVVSVTTSAEGGGLRLDIVTEQAALTDAIARAHLELSLPPRNLRSSTTWSYGQDLGDVEISTGGSVGAWDAAGTAGAKVRFEDMRVDTSITGDMVIDIGLFGLERFDSSLRVDGSASTRMVTEATVGGEVEGSRDFPIAAEWIWIPNTPVVVQLVLDVEVGVSAAAEARLVRTDNLSVDASLWGDVSYGDGGWTGASNSELTTSFVPAGPTALEFEGAVRGTIELKSSLQVMGLAGPYIASGPYVEFSGQPRAPSVVDWSIDYGLQGTFGVEVEGSFLGIDLGADWSASAEVLGPWNFASGVWNLPEPPVDTVDTVDPPDTDMPPDTVDPPDTVPPVDTDMPVDTDPVPTCPTGNGLYCGDGAGGRDAAYLYRCTDGAWVLEDPCALGCTPAPPHVNDACTVLPPCPDGDRPTCGDGVHGDVGSLYDCAAGAWTPSESCTWGCDDRAGDDACADPPVPQCPAGDGSYCGDPTLGQDPDLLYACFSGVWELDAPCEIGCQGSPGTAQCTDCANGAGYYCGDPGLFDDGSRQDRDTLYWCSDGMFEVSEVCTLGCLVAQFQLPDVCATPGVIYEQDFETLVFVDGQVGPQPFTDGSEWIDMGLFSSLHWGVGHAGRHGLEVRQPSPAGVASSLILSLYAPAGGGDSTTVDFWIKLGQSPGVSFDLELSRVGASTLTRTVTANSWQHVTGTLTSSFATTAVLIKVGRLPSNGANAALWIDDVAVTVP